ncbi:hypothetical protein [uncultured Alistipes sp.]|uniref:hypothetical protein n=1 Tax=uncultured Alistipes sp. TaxID=538949 RepID=UPI00262A9E4C|nr:hypothetical protein [uncultured Alistipes sp.]
MEQKTIRKLRKGELFRLSDRKNAPVWVRGEYIRGAKNIAPIATKIRIMKGYFLVVNKVFADFIFWHKQFNYK